MGESDVAPFIRGSKFLKSEYINPEKKIQKR